MTSTWSLGSAMSSAQSGAVVGTVRGTHGASAATP